MGGGGGTIFSTMNSLPVIRKCGVWLPVSREIRRTEISWSRYRPKSMEEMPSRLWDHYLGKHNIANLTTAAETTLNNMTYKMESKYWKFDIYFHLHMDQYYTLTSFWPCTATHIDRRAFKSAPLMTGVKIDNLIIWKPIFSLNLPSAESLQAMLRCTHFLQMQNTGWAQILNVSAFNIKTVANPKVETGWNGTGMRLKIW